MGGDSSEALVYCSVLLGGVGKNALDWCSQHRAGDVQHDGTSALCLVGVPAVGKHNVWWCQIWLRPLALLVL